MLSVMPAALFIAWALSTPDLLGTGDGKVPDVVGDDMCDATEKITRRELRWRIGEQTSSARLEANPESSFTCADDDVVRQRPAPGTELGDGGVVTLVTVCSDPLRPVGCA